MKIRRCHSSLKKAQTIIPVPLSTAETVSCFSGQLVNIVECLTVKQPDISLMRWSRPEAKLKEDHLVPVSSKSQVFFSQANPLRISTNMSKRLDESQNEMLLLFYFFDIFSTSSASEACRRRALHQESSSSALVDAIFWSWILVHPNEGEHLK